MLLKNRFFFYTEILLYDDCLRLSNYNITVTSILFFSFPPSILSFQIWQWFSHTSEVFTIKQFLVLSTFQCSFSLLISKHGSRNRCEIALFSTAQQPRVVLFCVFFHFPSDMAWAHLVFEHHFCKEKFNLLFLCLYRFCGASSGNSYRFSSH